MGQRETINCSTVQTLLFCSIIRHEQAWPPWLLPRTRVCGGRAPQVSLRDKYDYSIICRRKGHTYL
ncbi:hypothetical protein Ac2012v2_002497 [Leucoagaricus gongylophorus]